MWDKFIHSSPSLFDLLALAVCIGSLSCRVWVLRDKCDGMEVREGPSVLGNLWTLLGVSVAMLVLSSLIILIARSSEMSGLPVGESLAAIPRVVFDTHFGSVWMIRTTAVAVLCLGWWAGRRDLQNLRSSILMLTAALAIAATRSASSHAADAGDFSLNEIADWLHLLAASVWGGGLIALSAAVFPSVLRNTGKRLSYFTEIVVRFSGLAGVALFIVLITAVYQGWTEVGSFKALVGTVYGKIIILKITLALVLIMLAVSNRYISIPRLLELSVSGKDNDRTISRLVLKVRAEALIIAAILVCTAFLIHSTPAKHSFHPGHEHAHGISK
ncbi:MAG TPA: CopD family protein [Thermodesulfobacteriota bacterium]|nr:CopD family protein [Thermodesulfobacteriota bacterium]